MSYTYFPGCSLHAGGVGYEKSVRAVFARLGLVLDELPDWNCCGATAYMSVKKTVAYAISARNLSLAAAIGNDVVAPCAACFMVLSKTRKYLTELPELRAHVSEALAEAGLECRLDVRVRHPLEVLLNDVGIEGLRAAHTHVLSDFRPACYYGCQIVRPMSALPGDDPENPMSMERMLDSLGARCVDYPPKVKCCGGSLVITYEDTATKLCDELIAWAIDRDANCIVTVCPLCQTNLDVLTLRSRSANGSGPIPILYFTQVLGLGLGCTPEELGLEHGLTPMTLRAHAKPAGAPLPRIAEPALAGSPPDG